MNHSFKSRAGFLTVVLLLTGLLIFAFQAAAETDQLRVIVINVRQGDSTLVITPAGKTMLIDAGQSGSRYSPYYAGRDTVVPLLRSLGIEKVDVIVVSHPHDDHVGGIPDVIEEFPVGAIYDSGYDHTITAYERMLELAREKEIPVKVPIMGDLIPLCETVTVEVLAPTVPLARRGHMSIHDNMLVVRLEYGDFSFINTGDAEHSVEDLIISTGARLRSTVLNTGHHGSRTSTGVDFFYSVNPEIAIISAGKRNRFNHPDWEIANRLRKTATRTLRTDYHGNILIESDGRTYDVTTRFYVDTREEG